MEELDSQLSLHNLKSTEISEYLIPGSLRLSLQEQILEKYESGILLDADLTFPGSTQTSRLLSIYSDLGIFATPDLIQGNCSHSASISFLLSILSLISTSSSTLQQLENQISFIATNPMIFNTDLSLFPLNFPPKFGKALNVLKDLEAVSDYWKQEYHRMVLHCPAAENTEMASGEEIMKLKEKIAEFCKEIRIFRGNYEENIQGFMGEGIERNNVFIGKWSRACVGSYKKLIELFGNIESIWSSINLIVNS